MKEILTIRLTSCKQTNDVFWIDFKSQYTMISICGYEDVLQYIDMLIY